VVAGDPLYSPDLGKTGAIGDATKASVPAGDRFLTLCAARLSDLISAT